MTETERNQHNQQIETLYALYQQASSQRDVLMAQQRSKEAKTGWQGLTDDEREEICRSDPYRPTEMLKLAEAKLREKNT